MEALERLRVVLTKKYSCSRVLSWALDLIVDAFPDDRFVDYIGSIWRCTWSIILLSTTRTY